MSVKKFKQIFEDLNAQGQFGYWKQRFTLMFFVVWNLCYLIMFLDFDAHATLSDTK